MDGAAHFVAAERGDYAFDLPPVAEARDISVVAAALGPNCRLEARIVTVPFNEIGGIGKGWASMDEGRVHGHVSNSVTVELLRTSIVNLLLTTFSMA